MSETVLITGASEGIGRELARLFAADGCTLILTARSESRMRELAEDLKAKHNTSAAIFPCDLSQPGAAKHLFEAVAQAGHTIDILVNNAGFGTCGRFAASDPEIQEQMIHLNVTALTMLTRYCLDGMLARRRGRILNVASVAGFQPGPVMAVYYATKAFVISFSEALAEELRGSGVTVTCLCPGPTITEFQKRSGMEDTQMFAAPLLMLPAPVALAGHRALRRGKVMAVPGWTNKIMAQGYRIAPRALVRKIVMRMMKRSGRDRP